jgi:hypothetical protein
MLEATPSMSDINTELFQLLQVYHFLHFSPTFIIHSYFSFKSILSELEIVSKFAREVICEILLRDAEIFAMRYLRRVTKVIFILIFEFFIFILNNLIMTVNFLYRDSARVNGITN